MAKKNQSAAGWIVGVLAIVWIIPREIWIVLSIAALIGFVLWVWLRWRAEKKETLAAAPLSEPTLAELIQSSAPKAEPKEPIRQRTSIRSETSLDLAELWKASDPPAIHSAGLDETLARSPGLALPEVAASAQGSIGVALSPPRADTAPSAHTEAYVSMIEAPVLGPNVLASQQGPNILQQEESPPSAILTKAGNLAEAMKAVVERAAAAQAIDTSTEQVQLQIPTKADGVRRLAAALTAHAAKLRGPSRPGNLSEMKAHISKLGASSADPIQVEAELRAEAHNDHCLPQKPQAPPPITTIVPPPSPRLSPHHCRQHRNPLQEWKNCIVS